MTQHQNLLNTIQNAAETGATELDLRGRGLDSIPSEIGNITTLEVLWLDRNNLRTLPNTLQNLPNLHSLSLRHNQLATFPQQLTRLPNLSQLFLDHNRFQKVPKEVWQFDNLIALGLSGIKKPNLNGLQHYPNLLTLYLQECALHHLPKQVCSLEKLRTLYIEGNRFSDLPYPFINLQLLETIYLGLNALQAVPEVLLRMGHLRYISLVQNEIDQLPERIANWTELHSLVIANNPLRHLPEQIGTLQNLRTLYAYSADLRDIPASIASATNLELLELGSNQLDTLPNGLSALRKLERVNLFNNNFTELPRSLCEVSQLKELLIDSNRLRALRPEIGRLRNLEVLDLRRNRLDTLPSDIGRLSQLRVLRLAHNALTELPPEIGRLHQLTDLDLAANRTLSHFPATLAELDRLRTLTVTHIGLDIPPHVRDDVAQLRRFLSQTIPPADNATEPAPPRPQTAVPDDFAINFLPDINELKRAERRTAEPAVLRISRFDLDGIDGLADIMPYKKLQVVYIFEHSLLPVPPWFVAHLFLARTRRFRTSESWVGGGLLAYESDDPDTAPHVARLDSSLQHNALALTVVGPFPQNFFSLLLSGLDRIVDGLSQAQVAHRLLYCPDPKGENCRHRFDFDAILSSLKTATDDLLITCPSCQAEINCHQALAGCHPRTASIVQLAQDQLAEQIGQVDEEDAPAIRAYHHMLALRQRHFLQRFQRFQLDEKTHFPRLFVLRATSLQNQPLTAENLFDHPLEMQLCSELPGYARLVGARITITNPRQTVVQWRPYLLALKTILPTIYHTADDDWELREAIDETLNIIDLIPENPLISGSILEQNALHHAVLSLRNFFTIHRDDWYRPTDFRKFRTPEGLYLWLDRPHAKMINAV